MLHKELRAVQVPRHSVKRKEEGMGWGVVIRLPKPIGAPSTVPRERCPNPEAWQLPMKDSKKQRLLRVRVENFTDSKWNLTPFCKRGRHEHQPLCVQYTWREDSKNVF